MMRVAQVQQLTTEQTGSKDSACQASLVIPGKNTLALDLFFFFFCFDGTGLDRRRTVVRKFSVRKVLATDQKHHLNNCLARDMFPN